MSTRSGSGAAIGSGCGTTARQVLAGVAGAGVSPALSGWRAAGFVGALFSEGSKADGSQLRNGRHVADTSARVAWRRQHIEEPTDQLTLAERLPSRV